MKEYRCLPCPVTLKIVTTIDRAEANDSGILVWMSDKAQPLELSWIWVRDHSEDPTSLDPVNRQREVDTFSLDRTSMAKSVDLVDGRVQVEWTDGSPTSLLSSGLLSSLSPAAPMARPWRSPSELEVEFVPFDEVMHTNAGLRRWLEAIGRNGFGLVSGVPTDQASAQSLASRIGYVRRTIFGDMWTLSSEVVEHADSAYGSATLEPHTDGCYSHDGPGMQMFACSERTGTGGESVMVDGFAAADVLRSMDPDSFDLLTRVSVPGHYIEAGIHLQASRPTITLHADGSIRQVTFNNYDRSPFLLPAAEMAAWYNAYSAFHELLVDEASWWTHRLEPGDALMFDNWRCLHGRLAYTGTRVFHGCYVNHEDLESRLRVTA